MVLDLLLGLVWMSGAFYLMQRIIESPIYDLEELVGLIMQVSKLIGAFCVLM